MKRRNFLQASAALSIPAFVPITGVRANASRFASMIAPESDRILVIIHLFGGNDGINTVIPMDEYDGLSSVRKNFLIRESEPRLITDKVGLHPLMDDMQNMYKDGKLKIVQSVGYPKQNRSHFRSTDIYTTASDADEFITTGWLGRWFEKQYPGYPMGYPSTDQPDPPAISISDVSHASCEGPSINFSQTVLDPLNPEELDPVMASSFPSDNFGREMQFLKTAMQQTNAYNKGIQKAASRGRNAVSYQTHSNPLAYQLRSVAKMISGGLKTKIYTVQLSGFDTHAQQVTPDTSNGTHAHLLRQVSDAIGDFQKDLAAQGLEERVLGMTFSEFGRRIRPNASAGTDHGDAGPMFLFGSCVNAGITGDNVKIDPSIDQSAGVPMQFDFRDIYGSILVDWFDVNTATVKDVLHDDFKYMPLAGHCNAVVVDNEDSTPDGWFIGEPLPNTSTNEVSINLNSPDPGSLRYSLFDSRGRLVLVNEIRVQGSGTHTLFSRPTRLPAGDYQLRLVTDGGGAATRTITFN